VVAAAPTSTPDPVAAVVLPLEVLPAISVAERTESPAGGRAFSWRQVVVVSKKPRQLRC